MKDDAPDPAILKARKLFKASGKTLDELGIGMGYEGEVARKSAWQFLNKVGDPRLSSVRRFAQAMGVPLSELVNEK
jgi:transcriptional regulator with XRE-family HTH domain